ncbi:MAG: pyrroloquinoline quinone-dependent dehydrogenase [Proteobacteria bacterium]|nr:pyrroloquinoline quinone-dependent dehydrogenase [Pseudomonadota bacterium]
MAGVTPQSATRNRFSDSARRATFDTWLLAASIAVSLALAIFNYVWHGNGIHGTAGSLLVVISTALMLAAFIATAAWPMARWLRNVLIVLIALDIVGTGFAAYMLEAYLVVAAMLVAAVGFVASLIQPQQSRTAAAAGIAALGLTALLVHNPMARAQDAAPQPQQPAAQPAVTGTTHYDGWYTFNGDLENRKYSTAEQITPQNVAKLTKAWEVHTGDMSDGSGKASKSDWSATPLFVNNTVYVSTPFYRIFAIAPDSGKVKWTYDTHAVLKAVTQPDLKTRGVAYWQAARPETGKACDKMVYIGTMDAKLYAVDADSGKPCDGFANKGMLDLNQWNTLNNKWPLSILQPPTVYKDTLFIGWAGKDWADAEAPPGTVFAVDARTGALKWTFNALPEDIRKKTGTANVWTSMSIDPEHGILYLPISSPSPNFYGGNRKENIPAATSVTALNADTGDVIWSRQIVHHDIWDYDTNAAPTLVDIKKDGKTIPALVQTSKMGFIFVLNRLTGEPIYPIEERKVPPSDVAGEQAASTQPYPTGLEPTVPDKFPGISTIADIVSFGQCSRTFDQLRHDGRYTPPSLKGTLAYPSTAGGIEWGGGAVDPTSGVYVVNSSAVAQIYKLMTRQDYDAADKGADPGDNGYYPQAGSPYGFYLTNFVNFLGMPCWKPPYGTMSAYDLNTGKLLWRKPFGVSQKWGFYMPQSWGSVTIGGPLVTKSGLIFIGGSMDARVRAIDLKTGEVLWRALVDAPAVANPATYTYNGKQYVVFVAGGNAILKPQAGDQVVAYALPR